ncbi:hypothetical protein RclHR1_11380004 [Rhizophagus clarus]|uniref:Protein kinase domain-containing protein n=1 Tax=Rhizophagus clarus TaxID=94130 RepID=A0A2Z6QX29_9GLOM|nr:hypothetical protein RclHR1_11380004 [Rhizophagus clarus]GES72688.1 hypothetical protein GLOIN_2v1871094 [Rhizophagus clarus]
MKLLKEWIGERINNDDDFNHLDYNEFSNFKKVDKGIYGTLKKANWENRKITVVLKNLNNSKITETDFKAFLTKLKTFRGINNSNINNFFGLTIDSNENIKLISEYANEGNLKDYLKNKFDTLQWDDKLQMALDITNGLMCLHFEKKVIHGNLHARNVLVNNGTLMIADFKLLKQATGVTSVSENAAYIDPQFLRNSSYERDMRSDIYSLGVLLWELSSGRSPFSNNNSGAFNLSQIIIGIVNGKREEPVENTPLEYLQLYQKCLQDDPNLRPNINEIYEILSRLKSQFNNNEKFNQIAYDEGSSDSKDQSSYTDEITAEISSLTDQQIIKKFKLNHGLTLIGYNIRPSTQAVIVEDFELKKKLYVGQPLVLTYINSEYNESSDTCINFPVTEVTFNGNLLKSFLEFDGDEKELHELYGHFLARKFVTGGQLFIKDFNSATQIQKDILKFYLFCTYNSIKYSTEIQFSDLFNFDLLPRMMTLGGQKLNTYGKLASWMENLYQKEIYNIISYGNLVPISQLKHNTTNDVETFNKKWLGISNFKESLNLEEWVGDAVNDNLMSWTSDFNLFQGLIINKNDDIEISKKISVNIIKLPEVKSSDKSYLELIKPSTSLKAMLISNNIFSFEDLSSFPFIKNNVKNYGDYTHVLIKCEQYEILLNENNVRPTQEFDDDIEEALNSMKPLKSLQHIFNEYGHLFPQRILLGRLLKNILPNISPKTLGKINLKSPILKSLKPYLDDLKISNLLTQKRRIIEENDLYDWIQNKNNNLEIIEYNDIIPLYKILKVEQQRKIDYLLKRFNHYNIIMTGMNDLKDLDNNNIEHYRRIDIGSSFEDKNYEVFGSIILKNNSKLEKLEEFYVNFGLYDLDGFYAVIKKVEETRINITKCYISWIVIGKPSELSVFSPNNRELKVKFIKKTVKLQPNKENYSIETSFSLNEGCTVFAHVNHSPINHEPNNIIRLVKWKERSIYVQIKSTYKIESNINSDSSADSYSDNDDNDSLGTKIDLRICILFTNYKNLKIDNDEERECPLDLIGHILSTDNFDENLFDWYDKDEVSVNIQNNTFITNHSQVEILESNDKELINIETKNENIGSSSKKNIASSSLKNNGSVRYKVNNRVLIELDENGFTTPDGKARELIKDLTKTKWLYALKLLFEDPLNQFSSEVLRACLIALAEPPTFDYHEKMIVAKLELHMRTLVAVLEQICISTMRLSKELRDKVHNSLPKFAGIHKHAIQVMQEGNDNISVSDPVQSNKLKNNIIIRRNYNIDFLLIHLRDTLNSLRDDETWLREIFRTTILSLKGVLNIGPETPKNNNSSVLSSLTELHQNLKYKYPVKSYYVDWRIILIIQRNLFTWSKGSDKIISEKLEEMILMEYFWSYLEREWNYVVEKSNLDSQTKFDEALNKIIKSLKNTDDDESLTLPHTLWFGILDLVQNFIYKSTRTASHGLCYYLAIESLNKAPNSFIQFKAIEILLHLHNINDELFPIIEIDFDHYAQKLDSPEEFQELIAVVKEKSFEDLNILNDDIEKETTKGKERNLTQNSNILDVIADEMICSISIEPTDRLCILKCQHVISVKYLNKLKQKTCPECREIIEDNDIRYLPQNTIYKNLYSKFYESGHVLSSADDQYDSDDGPEIVGSDLMLTKKKKVVKTFKSNPSVSLSSILPKLSRKHPNYQNIIKELDEKHYKKAEYLCKEFLNIFTKDYILRCILAYIYRCLENYEQAHLYLNEAIKLKEKNPIAWYIRGEIFFREKLYIKAIDDLNTSISYKEKLSNIYILLGISYLFETEKTFHAYFDDALKNFNVVLQSKPNHYLCLKSCAYIYEKQENYLNTLEILSKLLNINGKDSLVLCYYGEILCKIGRYNDAIPYFTEANIIDPENVYNLNMRAIAYYVLQEYDKALLDLNKAAQLEPSNNITYYYRGLVNYAMKNANDAMLAFKKCVELDPHDNLAKMQLYYLKYLSKNKGSKNSLDHNGIITKIDQISNIYYNKSLLFMKCKIYIELEKYSEAKLDLNRLFMLNEEDISFICLLREYSDFWSYLYGIYKINVNDIDCKEFGIIDEFSKLIYNVTNVYFITNLTNLNNEFYYIKESDPNSLLGQVFRFKNEAFYLDLPKLTNDFANDFHYVVWKINVKRILSKNCFVKFLIKEGKKDSNIVYPQKEYILKYNDLLKLKGLGWIEYTLPIRVHCHRWIQLSIKASKGSIDMQIDYVRFKKSFGKQIYFPKMGHFLPIHKLLPNVPKAFKDKYFSRKEMENLLELKSVLDNL